VLQPFSVVVHEGGGTISSADSKALQQEHQQLFSTKHRDILAGFCPDINKDCRSWKNKLVPDVYSQYARERTQVLFVAPSVPSEWSTDSKDVRVYNIMQTFFKLGFKLSLDVVNYADSDFEASIDHLAEGVFMLPPRPLQSMVAPVNESSILFHRNSSSASYLYRCHFKAIYIAGAAAYTRFNSLWKLFCKNSIIIIDSYEPLDKRNGQLSGADGINKGHLPNLASVWNRKEDIQGGKGIPRNNVNIPIIVSDRGELSHHLNKGDSISTFVASQRLMSLVTQLGMDIPVNSTDMRVCPGVHAMFGQNHGIPTESFPRICKRCWYCVVNKYYFRPPNW
jgi:hypothetical protein